MRKTIVPMALVVAVTVAVASLWPTPKPDVDRLGDSVYETIWFWRIPAYANNPAWRVRWTWGDPLHAQARCCRATRQSTSRPGDNGPILPSTNKPIARLAG